MHKTLGICSKELLDRDNKGELELKLSIIIFLLCTLVGCATTNQLTLAEYEVNAERMLPPVSVFLRRPSEVFRQKCEAFDNESFLNHCGLNRLDLGKFVTELKHPGVFKDVLYANKDVGYRILVTTGSYNSEGGKDLGSAAIAGATLMLAPIVMSANIKVDAALYWYDYELKRFQYDLPIEMRASLLSMDQDTDRDVAKSVASHILRDVQAGELFSAAFLAKTLKSSDYSSELLVPDRVADYFREGLQVYNHPFNGAMVRYIEDTAPADYIDVFVYPIRSAHWSDEENILAKEIENVKKDIELFNKENNMESYQLVNNEFVAFQAADKSINSLMFEGNYEDSLSNQYVTQTYLMIIKDKFLKVRHTALKGGVSRKNIEKFISQLLKGTAVPEESLFMAKLRKRWRDSEAL